MLDAVLRQAFAAEFAFKLQDGLINGTGAGQLLGLLNSPALISVAKESGQVAGTLVKENIDAMWERCWAPARAQSVWLINQDVERALTAMTIDVGTGGTPVYSPPGGMSQAPYATLLGRPVVCIEQCSTRGTKGDIILASWPQVFVHRQGRHEGGHVDSRPVCE